MSVHVVAKGRVVFVKRKLKMPMTWSEFIRPMSVRSRNIITNFVLDGKMPMDVDGAAAMIRDNRLLGLGPMLQQEVDQLHPHLGIIHPAVRARDQKYRRQKG